MRKLSLHAMPFLKLPGIKGIIRYACSETADVVLIVHSETENSSSAETRIPAHKCILTAASPVFKVLEQRFKCAVI